MSKKGWIGVDLDATLAEYGGFKGMQHIGEPIPAMSERVKQWLKDDQEVRILTARVCSKQTPVDLMIAKETIRAWTIKHFGVEIAATSEKDYEMWELWDDRCRQVIPNTGITSNSLAVKIKDRDCCHAEVITKEGKKHILHFVEEFNPSDSPAFSGKSNAEGYSNETNILAWRPIPVAVDNTLKSYKWHCSDVNCATPCTLDSHCKGFEMPGVCPYTEDPVIWKKD